MENVERKGLNQKLTAFGQSTSKGVRIITGWGLGCMLYLIWVLIRLIDSLGHYSGVLDGAAIQFWVFFNGVWVFEIKGDCGGYCFFNLVFSPDGDSLSCLQQSFRILWTPLIYIQLAIQNSPEEYGSVSYALINSDKSFFVTLNFDLVPIFDYFMYLAYLAALKVSVFFIRCFAWWRLTFLSSATRK